MENPKVEHPSMTQLALPNPCCVCVIAVCLVPDKTQLSTSQRTFTAETGSRWEGWGGSVKPPNMARSAAAIIKPCLCILILPPTEPKAACDLTLYLAIPLADPCLLHLLLFRDVAPGRLRPSFVFLTIGPVFFSHRHVEQEAPQNTPNHPPKVSIQCQRQFMEIDVPKCTYASVIVHLLVFRGFKRAAFLHSAPVPTQVTGKPPSEVNDKSVWCEFFCKPLRARFLQHQGSTWAKNSGASSSSRASHCAQAVITIGQRSVKHRVLQKLIIHKGRKFEQNGRSEATCGEVGHQ